MAEVAVGTPFGHPPESCIEIPYRDEGNGGGAFYDHYTIQKSTRRHTRISVPAGMTTSSLQEYVKTESKPSLPYGIRTSEGKLIPSTIQAADRVGLLLITGHARETERKRPQALALRDAHERQLLQRAFLQGRPVVGICAGSWQLWSALGGGLLDVKDHAWERMPAITSKGKVGFNTQMHKVGVRALSMVAGALTDSQRFVDAHPRMHVQGPLSARLPKLSTLHPAVQLTVNSVHWKAPNPATLPRGLQKGARVVIAGRSIQDDAIAPKRKKSGTGVFKHPDANTVEVFEQKTGAPLLGIQWHPEAYNRDGTAISGHHRSLLTYMAKAGDAFCAKREMLDTFEDEFEDVVSRLREVKLS